MRRGATARGVDVGAVSGSFPRLMSSLAFRFVCAPAALAGAPAGWAKEMLRDGEIALLADAGGLPAVSDVAHALGTPAVPVIRGEATAAEQRDTVIGHAGSLPLVWVAGEFDATAVAWAERRGPMTLLVRSEGELSDEERRRIDRFVAILARQSE